MSRLSSILYSIEFIERYNAQLLECLKRSKLFGNSQVKRRHNRQTPISEIEEKQDLIRLPNWIKILILSVKLEDIL